MESESWGFAESGEREFTSLKVIIVSAENLPEAARPICEMNNGW